MSSPRSSWDGAWCLTREQFLHGVLDHYYGEREVASNPDRVGQPIWRWRPVAIDRAADGTWRAGINGSYMNDGHGRIIRFDTAQDALRAALAWHRDYVMLALIEGWNVPSEVLNDYPELAAGLETADEGG